MKGISRISPASQSDWDSLWNDCSYATYFHSREWAELWCEYTRGKISPDPKLVTFDDGKCALLPLSRWADPQGRGSYVSSPADTYGGWLSSQPLDVAHGMSLRRYLLTELGDLEWQLNPFDPLMNDLEISAQEPDLTQVVNLDGGFHRIYQGWTSACQRAERKAKKSGVQVRVADNADQWGEFFEVYQDSLRRWGQATICRYKWSLFNEMIRRNSPHVKLWLAMGEGTKVIAGAILLYAKEHVVYWLGAALYSSFPLRPVNLLFSHAIQDACAQGYRWFDFNSSAGIEGVRRFKLGFGAKELDCSVVHVSH